MAVPEFFFPDPGEKMRIPGLTCSLRACDDVATPARHRRTMTFAEFVLGRRAGGLKGHAMPKTDDDFPAEGDDLAAPVECHNTGELLKYLEGFGPGVPVTFNRSQPPYVVVRIVQLGGKPVISLE